MKYLQSLYSGILLGLVLVLITPSFYRYLTVDDKYSYYWVDNIAGVDSSSFRCFCIQINEDRYYSLNPTSNYDWIKADGSIVRYSMGTALSDRYIAYNARELIRQVEDARAIRLSISNNR